MSAYRTGPTPVPVVESERSVSSCTSRNSSSVVCPSNISKDVKEHNFDYFLVLDFEATCEKERTPEPQEIIEFPVIKVCAKTFDTKAVFHEYVKPEVHPTLSSFCTELTGIIQDMVDEKPHLNEVLKKFNNWMEEEGLFQSKVKFAFVTCGDWDLKLMLPKQCSYFGISLPTYMNTWINIKKSFAQTTGIWPKGLIQMLDYIELDHVGRLHSGIDDCRNIARILSKLAQRGHVFEINGRLDFRRNNKMFKS
ncbi:ERI1 exoribonuclease 3-like [Limulus polyphemus]|uniref:ERI1 exoribonuclease 3-like n=1 Tax=Limulus polyphemus TaxID=6850 RepID=A0ABM1BTL3_LIMPO|nr:ERI1 exoribonuclease 3-like [Limulus polyphemus]